MKLIRRIKLFFWICWNYTKLIKINNSIALTDPSDQDKRDLAMGRWVNYKLVQVPEFHIKMTKDDESNVFQHTFYKIGKGQPLTPDQLLVQVAEVISICESAYNSGKTLEKHMSELPQENK